ncbi:MAG: hypothetical protein ACTSUE_02200 [Promethearchaeota archaeon]
MGFSTGMRPRKGNEKVEPISYQCDNCGAHVSTNNVIPRCVGCGKRLCEICDNYLLCPQDFNRLKKRDQKKVKRLGMSLQSMQDSQAMFKFMPIGLAIAGGALLFLMIFLRSEASYFILSFLGGFLLLGAVMMFFTFNNIVEKERKRITLRVRDIVRRYNIAKFKQSQPAPQAGSSQGASAGERGIKLCKVCGAEVNSDEMVYCETCGTKLE